MLISLGVGIMATGAINVVRGSRSSVEELLHIYNHSERLPQAAFFLFICCCRMFTGFLKKEYFLLLSFFHNSVALAVDNPELYQRIAGAFNSEASVRFVILLWGEKSSISSHLMEGIPAYSYKEIMDMGREHRAFLVGSHDIRKSNYNVY